MSMNNFNGFLHLFVFGHALEFYLNLATVFLNISLCIAFLVDVIGITLYIDNFHSLLVLIFYQYKSSF